MTHAPLSSHNHSDVLRAIFDTTPECVKIVAPDGTLVDINPAGLRLLEADDESEVIGVSVFDVIAPEHLTAFQAMHERVCAGAQERLEFEIIGLRGTRRWMETHAAPLRAADGSVAHVAITRDITGSRQETLRRADNERRLRAHAAALIGLSRRMAMHDNDLEASLRAITEAAAEAIHVERASVWLYDEDGRSIRCLDLYHRSAKSHEPGPVLSEDEFPAYFQALRRQQVIAANDARTDPRTVEFTEGYLEPLNIRSMLDAPVWSNGALAAVVCHEHTGSPRMWSADDEAMAISIASFVSLALEMDRRLRTERELERACDEALAASRAKSEFLANVSHEIRTPMTAILGFADLLLAPDLTPSERIRHVRTMRRNSEHLLMVIDDILDLSKIESGGFHFRPAPMSPVWIVAEVASLMRVRAAETGIEFHVRFESPLPSMIESDPVRLRQILLNLVANALKFTERGSVTLACRFVDHVATGDSTWRDESSGMRSVLRFDVIDTGIGIDRELINHIFEPFTQVEQAASRRFGGVGLGLAISRRLVELLGGSLLVESKPGRGSTFSVLLPTGPLQGVPMIDQPAEAVEFEPDRPDCADEVCDGDVDDHSINDPALFRGFRGSGARILLAEDGQDNQRLLTLILRKAGHEVSVVENGLLAVQHAFAAQDAGEPFDIIFMDMQMPRMDGYTASRRLREEGYEGTIIALTAHAMVGDRERCLESGCDEYAAKPVSRRQLLQLIDDFTPTRA